MREHPRMRELLAHATSLGVAVHVAHIAPPTRGYYDAEHRIVVYGMELTPIERRCVLAHELGHAFYDHTCDDGKAAEDAADLYAARLLIDPGEYARAEEIHESADAIAEELAIEPDLVRVFQERAITRLRGVTYARNSRGSHRHVWA